MTFSSFGKIPISDDFAENLIRAEIAKFEEALNSTESDDRFTRRTLEQQLEKLEARLKRGSGDDARKDQVFTFEEMGVDMMFVDEAQEYRKLSFPTVQGTIKGIDPEGSQKAQDLFFKTRWLEQINPGRGMVFASGTPITNTLAELHTVQRYLGTPALLEHGVEGFDSWASTFGATESKIAQDPGGGYSYVTRFTGVRNAVALSSMVRRFMDVVTASQLREYVTVPEYEGGQREMVIVEQTPGQIDYQHNLGDRLEALRTGGVDPKDDNFLKLINDGRHSAIDMRFVDGYSSLKEDTKLEELIGSVYEIWRDTKEQPFYEVEDGKYKDEPAFHGPATQMVFSALGYARTGQRLHLPTYMRQSLVARGVPEEEIAYMGNYTDHRSKKRLFNDMNDGRVRILLGSEHNMGTGVNAQERIIALHNLMPLWYPALDEQRLGRAIRQGNMNPKVRVRDYSTKGTYDSTMWQLMARKAGFVEAFFRGDPNLHSIDDVGEGSQYQMASAMTTEDPRALRLAEITQELVTAEREKEASDNRLWNQRKVTQQIAERLSEKRALVNHIKADIEKRQDVSAKNFRMDIDSKAYTDRAEAGEAMGAVVRDLWADAQGGPGTYEHTLGMFAGFVLKARATQTRHGIIFGEVTLSRAGRREVGPSVDKGDLNGRNAIRSLEAQLRGMEAELKRVQNDITIDESDMAATKEALGAEAASWDRIDELRAAVQELERELVPEQTQPQPMPGAPPAAPDVLQQSYDARTRRWELGGEQYLSEGEAETARVSAQERAGDAAEQFRGGESQERETERLVAQYGTTESIEQAGYVLWDGSMLNRPAPGTAPQPGPLMRGASAVKVDARSRMIHAEVPLSDDQINTIVGEMDGRPGVRLRYTVRNREQVDMRTTQMLSPETLRSVFSRPKPLVLQQDGGDRGAYGAVLFNESNKAVIALGKKADFDTLMEELGHVFRRNLSTEQEAAVAEWAGARRTPTGKWSWARGAEEVFARGFVDWLREGVTPDSDATLGVFEHAKQWLRSIYAGMRSTLTPDVRRTFEDILLVDAAPEVRTFEQVQRDLFNSSNETYANDRGERLRAHKRDDGWWLVDAIGENGETTMRREHATPNDAAREVAGVRTVEHPAPMGSRTMKRERPEDRAERERDAEIRVNADEMTLGDIEAQAGEAEEQVLQQAAETRRTPEQLRELRLANLERGRQTQATRAAGRAQGQQEGRETEARRYEKRDLVAYGRGRIRAIRRSLAGLVSESSTLPAEVRDPLRQLLSDLKLQRTGRTNQERMELGTAKTDPLRLLSVLRDHIDQSDVPPGLLLDTNKTLAQLKLSELERLHNTIQHAIHVVRRNQARTKHGFRAEAGQAANEVIDELKRVEPYNVPGVLRGLVQVLGERPDYLVERIGGGMRSTTFRVAYRDVKAGSVEKRRAAGDAMRGFDGDLKRAGINMTAIEREVWMNKKVDVPSWAEGMHDWTRADLMSFALMWNDPYARRNLTDPDGGIVFTDRGRQATARHTFTDSQARQLLSLLGAQEKRFLGAPVRNLFDGLFQKLNGVFREKYGYDLERAPNYFPVQVAAIAVPDNPEQGGALDFYRREGEGGQTAEPFQGMVKWRTGAVKPMVLRPLNSAISQSVEHAVAYIGLEMPLTAARRLMANPAVTATMSERFGEDVPEVLKKYLRDQAGRGEPHELIDRALTTIRHNVTVAALGLNPKVALSQALSLPLYSMYMPARYVWRAATDMATPSGRREIMERHTGSEPDFAARTRMSFDPDVARGSGVRIMAPTRSSFTRRKEKFTNLVMAGISGVDRSVVATGMQAAVHHALDAFSGEATLTRKMQDVLEVTQKEAQAMSVEDRVGLAYDWARWITSRTQPSNLPEHLSHFARGKWTRLLTSFSGYTNVAWNALRYSFREARENGFRDGESNRAALVAASTILVVNNIGVGLLGVAQGLVQGREPDPLWLWKSLIGGVAGLFFIGRDVAHWLQSGGFGGAITPPVIEAIDNVARVSRRAVKAVVEGDEDNMADAVADAVQAGLALYGVPINTPRRYIEGIAGHLDD